MARCADVDVRETIETNSSLNLTPFIMRASALVDYVVTQDVNSILTDALAKQVETQLAAGFYALRDKQYASKGTGRSQAQFQVGQRGKGPFELNDWLSTAMALDITGTLAKLNEQAKNGTSPTFSWTWMGKVESDQIDYVDRN